MLVTETNYENCVFIMGRAGQGGGKKKSFSLARFELLVCFFFLLYTVSCVGTWYVGDIFHDRLSQPFVYWRGQFESNFFLLLTYIFYNAIGETVVSYFVFFIAAKVIAKYVIFRSFCCNNSNGFLAGSNISKKSAVKIVGKM